MNGTCQPGNTAAACGTGGGQCNTCASYEYCPSNSCQINPDSLWTVTAVSATFDTTKADGTSWDAGGGAPDGYVCYEEPPGTQKTCTSVVSNSFSPT